MLSDFEEVRGIIDALQSRTSRNLPEQEVKRLLSELLWRNIVQVYRLREALSVNRARWNKEKGRFTRLEDLGPPPPVLEVGGRCNAPGQPVCYCSMSVETALAEVSAKVGGDLHDFNICRPARCIGNRYRRLRLLPSNWPNLCRKR